jgi:dihydroflavonol-4-reductase
MVALVVGGTGFIGRHIVRKLASDGIRVRVLVRPGRPVVSMGPDVELVSGDIHDVDSLRACARGADLVFSAFGILGQWRCPKKRYWEVNSEGVRNLLRGCLQSGVRQFIHVSSAGVLGPLPGGVTADETFPFNPSNIYEKTKCQAEKNIRAFGERHRLPFTIIRPEFVYGPGDTHVLGLFRAIERRKFFIIGNGQSHLHPTYIDDLIRGIWLCVDNSDAFGQTFLITGGRSLTVEELATIMAEELGVCPRKWKIPLSVARLAACGLGIAGKLAGAEPPLTPSRVRFFTENRSFTFEKARAGLGYAPRVDFREGAKRTIRWYRDHGYL